ncbi:ASPIC/UnbV domain-containing protein, partial [Singulisphaera rosea]
NDPRVLVGIGAATQVSKLTLRWPSGEVTTQENLKADQSYSFVEPAGDSKATAVPHETARIGPSSRGSPHLEF